MVYRETRRQRPWILVLGVILALLLIVGGTAALNLIRPAMNGTAAVKADLTEMVSRLDLFSVEYPKQHAGQPSGAPAALRAARAAFDRAQPRLTHLDAGAATRIGDELGVVEQSAAAGDDARKTVTEANFLRLDIQYWLETH